MASDSVNLRRFLALGLAKVSVVAVHVLPAAAGILPPQPGPAT